MISGAFGKAYKACQDCVSQDGRVPYHRRAEIDAAAKTVFGSDGLSYHGQFHFYFGVFLFAKCAARTLPIWDRVVPDDNLGMYATLITKGIHKQIGHQEMRIFRDKCDSNIQKYIYDWDEDKINTAGAAGPSCTTALSMYLGEFNFATNAISEQDIDIFYWDSAFYSSVAVAGGAEWQASERKIDFTGRAEFWKWYVEEAIPQAYSEASKMFVQRS